MLILSDPDLQLVKNIVLVSAYPAGMLHVRVNLRHLHRQRSELADVHLCTLAKKKRACGDHRHSEQELKAAVDEPGEGGAIGGKAPEHSRVECAGEAQRAD